MKRILGRVTKEVAFKCHLEDYIDKKIVIYDDARKHCYDKHLKEFGSVKTFHYIMDNLENIISKPDYVFYKPSKKTLEYYKTYSFDITVRVRVKPGKELKVKTVFRVNRQKINNRIQKEIENQYIINK